VSQAQLHAASLAEPQTPRGFFRVSTKKQQRRVTVVDPEDSDSTRPPSEDEPAVPSAPAVFAHAVTADEPKQIVDEHGSQREKRIKVLRKKLREIEFMKARPGLLRDAQVAEKLSRLASYREELVELEAPKETAQAPRLVSIEDLWEKYSTVAVQEASNEASIAAQADDRALHNVHEGEACDSQHSAQTSKDLLGDDVQQMAVLPKPFEQAEPNTASVDVPESWMDLDDDKMSEPLLLDASQIEEDAPESWADLEGHVAPAFSLPAAQLEMGSVQAANSGRHSRARKDFLNLCKAASKWRCQLSSEELIERIRASRVASDCRAKHGDAFDERAFLESVLGRCGSP